MLSCVGFLQARLAESSFKQLPGAGTKNQESDRQLEEPACIGSLIDPAGIIAAVVIMAYNRVDYLQQCITSVLETHGQEPINRWASDVQAPL